MVVVDFGLILSVALCLVPVLVNGDALHPRRPASEEEFFRIGHHERASDENTMRKKIDEIKTRRQWQAWDSSSNKIVQSALHKSQAALNASLEASGEAPRRLPNVLILLADDLGYGDLSLPPFVTPPAEHWPCGEGGILSPQLERMARQGTVMTNFHSASPVCSPSRVAVMTSLFPWRLGALNAFELGQDMSQRNGFLPQVPTGPEIFRQAGYYTAHSGKWHLGGMREEMRLDRVVRDQCSRGSPNQHGFEEYVSELDGPESPRYTFFLRHSCLHSKGHRHLLRDDVPVPIVDPPGGKQATLSDREAEDAIQVMKDCKYKRGGQPWFIQVWFNAPHGPWEVLKSGEEIYSEFHKTPANHWEKFHCKQHNERLYDVRAYQYRTMVTAMDKSIGHLLDAIRELGEEENTIVVFTSDNGPEAGAGTAGPYKDGKRSLMEGGIRVPAVWQWKGVIPAGAVINDWGATVDILPTVMEAAGLHKPAEVKFDGLSLLSVIRGKEHIEYKQRHHKTSKVSVLGSNSSTLESSGAPSSSSSSSIFTKRHSSAVAALASRVFLWHKDTERYSQHEDRYQSSGLYEDLKVITEGREGCVIRIFDLKHDPFEHRNLMAGGPRACIVTFNKHDSASIDRLIDKNIARAHCDGDARGGGALVKADPEACLSKYHRNVVTKIKVILPKLVAFVRHGNRAHQNYMHKDVDKATCSVPVLSDIKPIDFDDPKGCEERLECSIPQY